MTIQFLLIILLVFLTVPCAVAEEAQNVKKVEERVSSVGAMIRSGIFPGWGQFYSRSYVRGGVITAGIAGSVAGAVLAQISFKNRYNAYATIASAEFEREREIDEAKILESYEYANQRYKLRMFFLYAGVGIWMYSIIDSYVSANFYNATTQIRSIQQDVQQIENKLGIQIDATPSHLYLGVVKTF